MVVHGECCHVLVDTKIVLLCIVMMLHRPPASSIAFRIQPVTCSSPSLLLLPIMIMKKGEKITMKLSIIRNADHVSLCWKKRLHIRVIGAPDKSRVETQTRLCIQLVTGSGTKVTDWPYLKLPERLLAHSRLKRAAQHQQQQELHDKQRAQPLSSSTSKHSSPSQNNDDNVEEDALHLDAKVVCASQPDVAVKVCQGCIQRERKRAERSKTSEYNRILEEFPEQDRILLFNCGPMVSFSSGDAILPTRIACYCRHHSEKKGFWYVLHVTQSHAAFCCLCIMFVYVAWNLRFVTAKDKRLQKVPHHRFLSPTITRVLGIKVGNVAEPAWWPIQQHHHPPMTYQTRVLLRLLLALHHVALAMVVDHHHHHRHQRHHPSIAFLISWCLDLYPRPMVMMKR